KVPTCLGIALPPKVTATFGPGFSPSVPRILPEAIFFAGAASAAAAGAFFGAGVGFICSIAAAASWAPSSAGGGAFCAFFGLGLSSAGGGLFSCGVGSGVGATCVWSTGTGE